MVPVEGSSDNNTGNAGASAEDDSVGIAREGAAFVQRDTAEDHEGPPKVDSEVEVLHEKVRKQVIKGVAIGPLPSKFATCFVHYRGWTEKNLQKFEDTWSEQGPVEVTLGKVKKTMTGLGIGMSSMKSGERALLHVGWELAYGEEGSFSFPNVPPMSNVIYEVELIGFDDVREGKARSDMTVEERIEAANRRKEDGNAYFKASSPSPVNLNRTPLLLFLPPPSTALPLCTDLRAPVTPKQPLSFCSYNETSCCNSTDDSNLKKQLSAMNISDASCSSLIKSMLCTRCDPFSGELYTIESKTRRTVPVLCSSGFCDQIWDTCRDVPIQNSPFAASLKGSGGGEQLLTSPASTLTDLWQSKTDFCRSFGGNTSVCFDGETVIFNTSIPPSPKGLCLERLWDGAYLNMAPHPDGSNRVFLANQDGKIWLATVPEHGSGEKLGLELSEPFLDLTDLVHRDTKYGMMGMAFHPDFASNGRFFASFNCDKTTESNCNGRCACNSEVGCDPSQLDDDGGVQPCQYQSVIAEFTANSSSLTTASPGEVRRILTMGLPYASNHGGQILFGPWDGYLYFMMGDGDSAKNPKNFAQNKKSLLGKILRLDVDNMPSSKEIDNLGLWGNYTIPRDNPYIEDAELSPEIWAMGFKNPWRCSFDSERAEYFFCADVGQNTYEEVDLVTKDGNYGWNVYEGPDLFVPPSSAKKPNTTKTNNVTLVAIPPIMGYKHVAQSASIIGGYVYRSQTDPCMFGRYLFADLYATELWAGTEDPTSSGDYNKTLTPFACSNDNLPMACDSVPGNELPSLGYIYSFGQDNTKDVFILTSKGVYRVVRPSRCGYTCPIEHDLETPTIAKNASSASTCLNPPQLGNSIYFLLVVSVLLLYAVM